MKIADSRNFKAAKNIAVAEVFVEVGGMRYALVIWAVHSCWLNLAWTGSCMLVPLLVHLSHHWRVLIIIVASYAAWVDIHYQRKSKNHSFCGTKQCEHVWFFRECRCIQLTMNSLTSSLQGRWCCLRPVVFRWVFELLARFLLFIERRHRPLYRKYWGRAAQVPWGTQDRSIFLSVICLLWMTLRFYTRCFPRYFSQAMVSIDTPWTRKGTSWLWFEVYRFIPEGKGSGCRWKITFVTIATSRGSLTPLI